MREIFILIGTKYKTSQTNHIDLEVLIPKKFQLLHDGVYVIPDEVFEEFVQTDDSLGLDTNAYLQLVAPTHS